MSGKNLMPLICEMLGLEIREEFKVENDVCLHRFTENGLEYKVCGVWNACARLNLILNGTEKIIKLPFEPKRGEAFWEVYWEEDSDIDVTENEWTGNSDDYLKKQCGNCFRTKAEAKAHKHEIYEKLTGKKLEELKR